MKFVGPPPHDFFRRAGLVAVMLAVAISAGLRPQAADASMTINIALGFVLLFWYIRELTRCCSAGQRRDALPL